jgi:hypothetical protein
MELEPSHVDTLLRNWRADMNVGVQKPPFTGGHTEPLKKPYTETLQLLRQVQSWWQEEEKEDSMKSSLLTFYSL